VTEFAWGLTPFGGGNCRIASLPHPLCLFQEQASDEDAAHAAKGVPIASSRTESAEYGVLSVLVQWKSGLPLPGIFRRPRDIGPDR
jgi:hypothetical protein